MFTHILVPLDESRLAEQVLPHIVSIAPFDDALITLLNVREPSAFAALGQTAEPVEWQLGSDRARSYLDSVAKRLKGSGLRVETELIEGDATVSILEFAKSRAVDLIAITSHGMGGEEIHPLGEVALKTLLGAKTSLLVVRSFNPVLGQAATEGSGSTARGYRRILVPLDGSLRAEAALPYAERLCGVDGGSLHLATVVRPTIPWPAGADDAEGAHEAVAAASARAERYLSDVGRAVEAPPRQLKTAVLKGDDIVGALDDYARTEQVEIKVMSAHGASGGTRTPYGSVTLDILLYGYTPLLVVQDRATDELRETHAERAAKERQGHT